MAPRPSGRSNPGRLRRRQVDDRPATPAARCVGLAERFGVVHVYLDYLENQRCDTRCQQALGDDCVCRCAGQYHGGASYQQAWTQVGETTLIASDPRPPDAGTPWCATDRWRDDTLGGRSAPRCRHKISYSGTGVSRRRITRHRRTGVYGSGSDRATSGRRRPESQPHGRHPGAWRCGDHRRRATVELRTHVLSTACGEREPVQLGAVVRTAGTGTRKTRRMATGTGDPEHLLVAQAVFAGERFWSALERLADRRGHDGHSRVLVGFTEPTNRYELQCLRCERPIATMDVARDTQSD